MFNIKSYQISKNQTFWLKKCCKNITNLKKKGIF